MPGRMVRSQEPKAVPDELREGDGQVLKQSLADDTRLDEDVVGVELALDGVAVFERRAMEMLIAACGGAAASCRTSRSGR